MTVPLGLARRTLGGGALFFFSVGASSPMTVLVGGVVATFAGTGIVAVPAAFPIITVALALFTVGYVAMARYVPHAGPLYAYVARGLGPGWGLVMAPIALLSYNAIAISLYGLLGTVMSGAVGGPWWLWGLIAWAVVAVLGVGHVAVNARLLALLLVAEIGVIILMDAAALTHPADGQVSLAPLLPGNLTQVGAGGVFGLSVAAFIGYESSLAYGEEARGHTAVARATIGSLLCIGVLYAVSSWAMTVAVGPDHVVDAARDPAAGIPLSIVVEHYGRTLGLLAGALLVTSVFAAMLSLHNTTARYVFVLSRERLLPPAFGRVGRGTRAGAPIGGSVLQSTLGLAVLTGCAVVGADPLRVLFTQLSAVAAIGVMTLMVAVSVAALRFYQRGGGTNEGPWTRVVAPLAGAVSVGAILLTAVVNLDSLLGVGPPATVVLPGVVVLAGVAGGLWGVRVRRQPEVYRAVGRVSRSPSPSWNSTWLMWMSNVDGDGYEAAAARVRNLVIDRLLRMNARHATHAWLQRRSRPVGPHGLAFLYADQPNPDQLAEVAAATRLVDDTDEVRELPRLLYRLTNLARERYLPAGRWDPREMLANRCDPMTDAATYIGLGVSSLDTSGASWSDNQRRARGPFDLPGRCFILLADGTMLLVERGGQDVFGEVQVMSTHDLNVEPGIASRRWRWCTDLHAVDGTTEIWRRLYDLHELAARVRPNQRSY